MGISEIYQFHAWLRGISPLIWRRLLVRSDQTVANLHYALQLAFGWSDSHLNNFRIHGQDFGVYHTANPETMLAGRRQSSDASMSSSEKAR